MSPADTAVKEYDPKTATQSVQAQARASQIEMMPTGLWAVDGGIIWVNMGRFADEIPAWSLYPGLRDYYLRNIAKYEPMMASGIYSMKTRMVTLGYEVQGPETAKQLAQELLQGCDFGRGLVSLLAKGTDDLMSTDNGLFIEKMGPGDPLKPLPFNLVTGFAHLDSRRCYRTFNPEFPVIYDNPETGALHKLHRDRVVMIADNPQPIERARGIGLCAVSRALQYTRIMRDTLTYREEKIAGRFTRAIGIAQGISVQQLKDSLNEQIAQDEAAGFIVYRNIPILAAPAYQGKSDADLLIKDLASIPDGFEFESDMTLYAYLLAFAFGVDAREFWPATAAGATKADATVQHQKAQGRGIGALIRTWEWAIRQCLPETVEFTFDFTDDEQDLMRHQVQGARINNLSRLQIGGAIDAEEVRSHAIAEGILDPKLLKATMPKPPANEDSPDGESGDEPDEPVDEDTPEGEKTLHKHPFDAANAQKAAGRAPTNASYERAANDFQMQLEAAAQDAIDRLPDEPTAQQIADTSERLLADLLALMEVGLSEAYGVGLGGSAPTVEAMYGVQQIANSQRTYLVRYAADFSAAITAGLITGLVGAALRDSLSSFVSRAALYAGSFWETLWRGLGDALSQEDTPLKVRRVLDDGAQHCQTCPPKAREYDSYEQMVAEAGIPGDGNDDCLSNCRCWIEVETSPGSGIFERFNGKPTVFVQPIVRMR